MLKQVLSNTLHQNGAYPDFCSIKQLGVFLLLPDGNLVHHRVAPSIRFASAHLYTCMNGGGCVREKCLAQEHNTMSLVRARTRTAPSEDERTNHETTAQAKSVLFIWVVGDNIYLTLMFQMILQRNCLLLCWFAALFNSSSSRLLTILCSFRLQVDEKTPRIWLLLRYEKWSVSGQARN